MRSNLNLLKSLVEGLTQVFYAFQLCNFIIPAKSSEMAHRGPGELARVSLARAQAMSTANHHNRDDPPPSTIAAQIVHNRANPAARQAPENQALFSKLLQEYLKVSATDDTSVDTNAQLVFVVADAGLDRSNDIFAPQNERVQVFDSLRVIQLTIRRCPELLFRSRLESNHDDWNSKAPLVSYLLPKLFSLLMKHDGVSEIASLNDVAGDTVRNGVVSDTDIRNMILDILKTSILSCRRTPHLLRKSIDIDLFLRSIVDGKND